MELLKLVVKEDEAEGAAAGEESEKKEKRDPRKPKKPLSAYLLWSQEVSVLFSRRSVAERSHAAIRRKSQMPFTPLEILSFPPSKSGSGQW